MPKRQLLLPLIAAIAVLFTSCSSKVETQSETEKASTEASVSTPSETTSSGNIEYIKWTPEVNVPDPVSISFDDRGRAYVTQTRRRRANDIDIRSKFNIWLRAERSGLGDGRIYTITYRITDDCGNSSLVVLPLDELP